MDPSYLPGVLLSGGSGSDQPKNHKMQTTKVCLLNLEEHLKKFPEPKKS